MQQDVKRMSEDSAVLEAKIKANEEGVSRLRQAKAKAKQAFEASTRVFSWNEQQNYQDQFLVMII